MGSYGREPQALIEDRISTVECLQVTIDTCIVGFSEGRYDEAFADTLALGRRGHADNGQIPGCLGNCDRRTLSHKIDDASVRIPTSGTERHSEKLIFCLR